MKEITMSKEDIFVSKKINLTVHLDMSFLDSGRDLALNVTLTCSQEGTCNKNTSLQANFKNGFLIGFFV
jgi:hypothetical protein